MPATRQYPIGSEQTFLTLTHPNATLWIIELHNGIDNRLTEALIEQGLKPALDVVEKEWRESWRASKAKGKDAAEDEGKGAVIIVGKRTQDKFFSNGLDLVASLKNPNFFPLVWNPMMKRILSFPIPTIAAINGHCFAGGMILSLCCDYRIMTDGSNRNAWMCMNEVHFGAPWMAPFAYLLKDKVTDHITRRKVALEGARFTPPEALQAGLVDYIVNGKTDDILAKATQLGSTVGGLAQGGVWGLIKRDLYRDTLKVCDKDILPNSIAAEDAAAKARL